MTACRFLDVRMMSSLFAAALAVTAAAAPSYDIAQLGFDDPEHTRNDGYQFSVADQMNEAGRVVGYSQRFNGGSAALGQSIWLFNGAATINAGLTGSEHTKADGYKFSTLLDLNEAGQVSGWSTRYNGGSTDLGQTAWFNDGTTTTVIGFTGAGYTHANGHSVSYPFELNEAGQIRGYSVRYNGSSSLGLAPGSSMAARRTKSGSTMQNTLATTATAIAIHSI